MQLDYGKNVIPISDKFALGISSNSKNYKESIGAIILYQNVLFL